MRFILGIETSCDDCSLSIVQYEPYQPIIVRSVKTHSELNLHQRFGGIVPEIASRSHLTGIHFLLDDVCREANIFLPDIDAIAVTTHPGLIGSLLVGVGAAKAWAYAAKKPLIGINHLEGHISSIFLGEKTGAHARSLKFPLLVALISGGHTNLYVIREAPESWYPSFLTNALIGTSRDDSAGETFDKAARLLKLPYPGGPFIEKVAQTGNPNRFKLPRPLMHSNSLDFSFSGLKTAFRILVDKHSDESLKPDLCASLQEAITDVLVEKIQTGCQTYQCKSVAIVGGVAANQRLREKLQTIEHTLDQPICFPEKIFCTDNAAMIAANGAFYLQQGFVLDSQESLLLTASAT
jgi:N6-L-threonylcarbamoyladenine synthase